MNWIANNSKLATSHIPTISLTNHEFLPSPRQEYHHKSPYKWREETQTHTKPKDKFPKQLGNKPPQADWLHFTKPSILPFIHRIERGYHQTWIIWWDFIKIRGMSKKVQNPFRESTRSYPHNIEKESVNLHKM